MPRTPSPEWRCILSRTPKSKPAVGLTMFGVTTACVTRVVEQLEEHYDCLVFHATGTGGQSLEKLVDSGMLVGVIDATTTEVCDELVGGCCPRPRPARRHRVALAFPT